MGHGNRISIERPGTLLPLIIIIQCLIFGRAAQADEFSYRQYADVLGRHVDEEGNVNYKGLKADRAGLDAFNQSLGTRKKADFDELGDPAKIAFLINAYNALTLEAIIDHYPITPSEKGREYPANSIRQIEGAWDDLKFTLLGEEVTLNRIEHEWLRPRFDEPRIHMALVCAAMSCPPLRNEPYSADRLEAQLDDQTRKFLDHPKKFKLDMKEKKVYLSQLFSWFGKDWVKRHGTDDRFVGRDETMRAVLNFIQGYLENQESAFLLSGEYRIEYLHYDWTLNEQKE
jgi:hypothetical protein